MSTSPVPTASCSATTSTKCARSSAASWRGRTPSPADLVTPVPDSGVPAAIGYAEESELPLEFGLIRNHYVGRTFIEPQQTRSATSASRSSSTRSARCWRASAWWWSTTRIVRGTTSRKIITHAARRRRQGSAHAHQLSADDRPLLLRHRHADPHGTDRVVAHGRRNPPLHRGRHARLL